MGFSLFHWGAGVLSILAALSPAQTATSKTVQLGATVENTRLEQDSKIAFVRVINRSERKITAINLSVDITFTNGKTDHFEQMFDLLTLIVSKQSKTGVAGEGALAPGEGREIRIDAVNPISSIHSKVDMVAYLDLSAEVDQNQEALNRLVFQRKNRALAARQIADVISEAAASSVTPDASGMAVNRLRQMLDEAVSQQQGDKQIELRSAIADLQSARAKSDLKGYAKQKNDAAVMSSAHANVRRIN